MTLAKPLRQILLLLFAAMLPAAVAGMFHPKRPAWSAETLAPGEVALPTALGWGDKVLWLDARSEKEFDASHIPGGMLLNEDDWDDLLPRMLAAWRPGRIIVVYCSSLRCQASQEVAERLRKEARLPEVYVLKGGWEAWLAAKK